MTGPIVDVRINGEGVVSRRGFLRRSTAAGLGAAAGAGLGLHQAVTRSAEDLRRRGKAMILLWMDGGPSQFETFNPKVGSENQGPTGAIQTCLPGVRLSEYWPKTARVLDKVALIRSMVSDEKVHDRAIALVRTGYPPSVAIQYPTFGSVVAREREDPRFDLPAFVRIGSPRIKTRDVSSGVLGVRYASFNVDEPGHLPDDVRPLVPPEVLRRRLDLSSRFDAEFARDGGAPAVAEKRDVYDRAERFVLSPRLGAFDLSGEPEHLRDSYGRNTFGQGCLLARRLVERGVSFVEVISTGGRNDAGWDTHNDGFRDTPHLCNEADPGYSTLLLDLAARGLLEDTLVVWMGEFGRTPKLKPDGGREHYSEGWLAALAGGGVAGGQVIGATDRDGVEVTDRPVTVPDLFVSVCRVLGIDPGGEYVTADDRPIRIVEGGAEVAELFA